jgi:hypothetical protein
VSGRLQLGAGSPIDVRHGTMKVLVKSARARRKLLACRPNSANAPRLQRGRRRRGAGCISVSNTWAHSRCLLAVDVRACRRRARIAPSSCCSNRDFTTRVGCFADAKLTRRAVMCYHRLGGLSLRRAAKGGGENGRGRGRERVPCRWPVKWQ